MAVKSKLFKLFAFNRTMVEEKGETKSKESDDVSVPEKQEEHAKENKQDLECQYCHKKFGTEEALNQHLIAKHSEKKEEEKAIVKPATKRKVRNWVIFFIILAAVVYGFYSLSSSKSLPPTDFSNHIEQNPPSHILKVPMPLRIQKHMLEHADGTGPPGVIINYDCKNYKCESDLIPKLEGFAPKYPDFVYVAPFKNMPAKIVLTRQGAREILDEYNEEKIDDFINRRI